MAEKISLLSAMGKRLGDYIHLSNQWAQIDITRDHREIEVAPRLGGVPAIYKTKLVYIVSGDTWDGDPKSDKQNAPTKREYIFNTGPEALRFALQSLAAYYAQSE